jgi:membrane associated rhomboid family serine protease
MPVTLAVFAVTAALGTAQVGWPAVLDALARTPAVRDGEVWRLLTALTVQDGGLVGTLSNLAFLLVVGGLAERVLRRWRWLACYLGAGLVGNVVGLWWQPYGAGNSVAVCGVCAGLAVALVRRPGVAPRFAPVAVAWWCAALLAQLSWVAFVPGAVLAAAAPVLVARADPRLAGRVVAGYALLVGAVLTAARDVHGAALLGGFAIAAAVTASPPARAPGAARTPA